MATLRGSRSFATQQTYGGRGDGALCVAYGSYDFTVNPTIADTVELCRVPKGAVILGGYVRIEDVDTNVAPTFDIDLGWTGNSDALGNFGVLNGTAVTNYLPEGGTLLPLHGDLKDGFITLTAETVIAATVVAAAATFAAGTISVVVLYTVP